MNFDKRTDEMKIFSKDGYLPVKSIGLMFVGSLIYSLAMNILIIPCGMYSGGVLGIAQLINALLEYLGITFSGVNMEGIIYLMINIPLLILAYKSLGRPFFFKTIVCTVFYTIFLAVIPVPEKMVLDDTVICCVAGGLISGIGIGFTLLSGGCGGGEEIICVYLTKKYHNFSVGKVTVIINIFVYGCCAIFFNLTVAVYSILCSVISSIAVDKIHFQNITADMFIVTKKSGVEKLIFDTVNRGATRVDATGTYTGDDTNIYLVVLSKNEAATLKKEIHAFDPDAFVFIHEDVDVSGNFQKHLH